MNDNDNWLVLGQAAASRVAKALAHHASWNLATVAAYHGLPMAAFLQNEATALIVAVTDGALPVAAAQMEKTLIEARCDGLIIADETNPWSPPWMAFGSWRSGKVVWHQPMSPWADHDGTLWLVPADSSAADPGRAAVRLVARYLRAEPMPWQGEAEHAAGLQRAAFMLRGHGA